MPMKPMRSTTSRSDRYRYECVVQEFDVDILGVSCFGYDLFSTADAGVKILGKSYSWGEVAWVLFGFAGQFAFFMRFFIQWLASEKRKQSVVPVVFWYWSIVGGGMLAVYAAVHLHDIVFASGQILGMAIYIRNLVLIYAQQRKEAATVYADDGHAQKTDR